MITVTPSVVNTSAKARRTWPRSTTPAAGHPRSSSSFQDAPAIGDHATLGDRAIEKEYNIVG